MRGHFDQSGLGALFGVYGLGYLAGKPVYQGDRFIFGCNFSATELIAPNADKIVAALESNGLSYDTVAAKKAGFFRVFIQAEGNSNLYWDDSESFKVAIFGAIQAAGYEPNWASVNFWVDNDRAVPDNRVGTTASTPNNDSAPPGAPGKGLFQELADSLGVTKGDAKAIVAGGIGLVVLLAIRSRG